MVTPPFGLRYLSYTLVWGTMVAAAADENADEYDNENEYDDKDNLASLHALSVIMTK